MLIALMLAASTPSPAAVALGERLARAGTLAALLPLMVTRDIDELVAAQRDLAEADRAALRRIAQATARAQVERLLAAEGRAYAAALPEADLAALVTHAESPAGRRLRAALPGVIAGTMAAVGEVDLKKEALAAFCRETGKACPPGARR